jgi:hypothetical protein
MTDKGDEHLKDVDLKELVDAFKASVEQVYAEAPSLPQQSGLEQAIVFRVGVYFSRWLFSSEKYNTAHLDCEYNKSRDRQKITPNFENGIRPDMILHTRKNTENNILCIEFKGWWQTGHKKDRQKLRDLTRIGDPNFSYRLGLFVNLQRESAKITYFHPWFEPPNLIGAPHG